MKRILTVTALCLLAAACAMPTRTAAPACNRGGVAAGSTNLLASGSPALGLVGVALIALSACQGAG